MYIALVFNVETTMALFCSTKRLQSTAIACLVTFQIAAQTQINRGSSTKRVHTRHRPNHALSRPSQCPQPGDPGDPHRNPPEHAVAGVRHDHGPEQLHREVHELGAAQELGSFPDGGGGGAVHLSLGRRRGSPAAEEGEAGVGVDEGGGGGELVGAEAGEGVLCESEGGVVGGVAGGSEVGGAAEGAGDSFGDGDAHRRQKRLTAYPPLWLTGCQAAFLAMIDVGVECRHCRLQV